MGGVCGVSKQNQQSQHGETEKADENAVLPFDEKLANDESVLKDEAVEIRTAEVTGSKQAENIEKSEEVVNRKDKAVTKEKQAGNEETKTEDLNENIILEAGEEQDLISSKVEQAQDSEKPGDINIGGNDGSLSVKSLGSIENDAENSLSVESVAPM
mmetsp:Transcript_34687/g.45871  ORF Transcript_34687/g.45871 Transcript_34687/m.45871 type:complete len:157 (+) Transcript_34687:119-589(+)